MTDIGHREAFAALTELARVVAERLNAAHHPHTLDDISEDERSSETYLDGWVIASGRPAETTRLQAGDLVRESTSHEVWLLVSGELVRDAPEVSRTSRGQAWIRHEQSALTASEATTWDRATRRYTGRQGQSGSMHAEDWWYDYADGDWIAEPFETLSWRLRALLAAATADGSAIMPNSDGDLPSWYRELVTGEGLAAALPPDLREAITNATESGARSTTKAEAHANVRKLELAMAEVQLAAENVLARQSQLAQAAEQQRLREERESEQERLRLAEERRKAKKKVAAQKRARERRAEEAKRRAEEREAEQQHEQQQLAKAKRRAEELEADRRHERAKDWLWGTLGALLAVAAPVAASFLFTGLFGGLVFPGVLVGVIVGGCLGAGIFALIWFFRGW